MPSLPEAVDLKYGDDYPAQVTEVACVALSLKRKGRMRLPSVMILSECDIEEAGDEEEVQKTCEGVRELDVSRNKFKEWPEVVKILRNLPCLCFLNLSYNTFVNGVTGLDGVQLAKLTRFVLNGTELPWRDVHKLLEHTPRLEELHLCMNNFKTVDGAGKKYPSINRIHFNSNPVSLWSEVEALGDLFPNLEVLILAECPLKSLSSESQRYVVKFPNLKYLSLNSTQICSWDSVDMCNCFPKLSELRLQSCPLFEEHKDSERRSLTIARVWKIQRLNGGSMITEEEREMAERSFIRHYKQQSERPKRYDELVSQHGDLEPLVEVNLKPEKYVKITVRYREKVLEKTLSVYLRVVDLKKLLEPELGLPASKMRLFYIDRGVGFGEAYAPEEIKLNVKKQLYAMNVHTGDEFYIESKIADY
ncbi:unnamed protein product [Meganyctiphanes norvegica]|uniref:Ubiquitin-like domain-containing protein n=1 Tax=Meganyctiphanes norvegica TaxID=48144 RepID=A0AAV2RBA0_MEGNR